MVEITSLLSENVKKHFLTLPASHQKEWVSYINEAKKEETRLKRVLKMKCRSVRSIHWRENPKLLIC